MIPIDGVPLHTHSSYIALNQIWSKVDSSLEAGNSNVKFSNVIYEECVCRGTPSIGIITNSGLILHHNLGHYLLWFQLMAYLCTHILHISLCFWLPNFTVPASDIMISKYCLAAFREKLVVDFFNIFKKYTLNQDYNQSFKWGIASLCKGSTISKPDFILESSSNYLHFWLKLFF